MTRLHLHLLVLGGLLLAACAKEQPAPTEGSFTITVEPPAIELRVHETADVLVEVLRSEGFSEAVTLSIFGDTAGLEVEPVTVAGAAGSLQVTALATAEPGGRVVMVTATSGESVRYEPLSVLVLPGAAVAAEVTVTDGTGTAVGSVRQGAGTLTLTVAGSNLSLADGFSLGEIPLSVLPGSTDSQLQLEATVDHGATPGTFDLVISTGGEETVLAGVLAVTPISVATTGSDAGGRGTTDSPFRTLTHALAVADSGDTVSLASGTYSETTGEVWPLVTGEPNVPAGVVLVGEGATLLGPGAGSSVAGLSFAAGDSSAVYDVVVSEFGAGFLLAAAGVTVEISDSQALGNGMGVLVQGGHLSASGTSFSGGETGVQLLADAHVNLVGVVVDANTGSGIEVEGTGAVLSVTLGLLSGNGLAGLWFDGARLRMRDTEVADNGEFGIYVEGEPLSVDLGTGAEAGNNDIHGNGPGGTGDQLLDVRPARATLGVPVVFTISATKLAGVLPVPDVYVGPYLGHPLFSILGENNTVQVY